MNENYYILTLEETEELCRLYRECRLTPIEEAELHYVLMHSRFNTPLIRETLDFMNMERLIGFQPQINRIRRASRLYISIAASIVILLGAGFIYFLLRTPPETKEPVLALRQTDNADLLKPLEGKMIAATSEPETELPIEKTDRTIRTPNSSIIAPEHSSDVIPIIDQSYGYTEVTDDKEVIKIFEDIQIRWSKLTDISVEINENLMNLNNVEQKIIEKNLKI